MDFACLSAFRNLTHINILGLTCNSYVLFMFIMTFWQLNTEFVEFIVHFERHSKEFGNNALREKMFGVNFSYITLFQT